MGVTDDVSALGTIKADPVFKDLAGRLKEIQQSMGGGSGQGGKYLTGDRLAGIQKLLQGSLAVQKRMLYNLEIIAKRTGGTGGGRKQKDPAETAKKIADAKAAKAETDALARNKFKANLESRFYTALAKQITDNVFGTDGLQQDSGTFTSPIGGEVITWTTTTNESPNTVSVVITETDGTVTTYTFPKEDNS